MPSTYQEPPLNLTHTIYQDLAIWARTDPRLLARLYDSPHATQAVFRALPPLARLYVSRLLYVPSNEPHATLDVFRTALRRRQRAKDRHDAAVRALKALHVFVEGTIDIDNPTAVPALTLNDKFAAGLRASVSASVPPVFGGPVSQHDADHDDMAAFSAAKLERILNYLVESSGGATETPSANIVSALLHARILETRREGMTITSAGFQFLLQDTFAQLWVLLRAVVYSMFPRHRLECMQLLFRLSFSCPGKAYSTAQVDDVARDLLDELHELGIVLVAGKTFRPTVAGVRLLSSAGRAASGTDAPTFSKSAGEIEIFVETNFRVYAYTTSAFQISLLGLFTHLRYKLPGMVVGHLTRDAVRKALQNGITADQIIGYLNAHAHRRMKKGVVPANVSDEIRLWEAEQERVATTPGVLLADFDNATAFESILAFANDIGVALWSNSSRRQIVVAKHGYESIKRFIKSQGVQ